MRRRIAREIAIRTLYQIDLNKESVDTALEFVQNESFDYEITEDIKKFSGELVSGVLDHLDQIDMVIVNTAKEWSISRMNPVDRNIIRVAIYEILYTKESISVAMAINEAVELARDYGEGDSQKFVNGVLGNIIESMKLTE